MGPPTGPGLVTNAVCERVGANDRLPNAVALPLVRWNRSRRKPRTCRGFKSHEEMPRGGNISRQPDDIQWPETCNKKVEAPRGKIDPFVMAITAAKVMV
jgi:hypothetical protein